MAKINLNREVRELKRQLSYSRSIGFFFGAGTSCALGIPNIEQLTNSIEKKLSDEKQSKLEALVSDLKTVNERKINIEDILNQLRKIRDLTCDRCDKEYQGISGEMAKEIDQEICKNIYGTISQLENEAKLSIPKKFFSWLTLYNRDFSKEIFTTNYDLIIEKSLEANQIPYFDGFVGSYEPFFLESSIEHTHVNSDLSQHWIKLWKLHGSLSWFWKEEPSIKSHRIIRLGKIDDINCIENELVIYPSKDKYDKSRKQPFIAYFDRLRNYLLSGELLFVFTGYSFSDQHINDIIFNCLRENNRLFAIIFFYSDGEVENFYKLTSPYLNLNVFGPTKAIINGELGDWHFDKDSLKTKEKYEHYWDDINNRFLLGNFNNLVEFLIINSGNRELIEKAEI